MLRPSSVLTNSMRNFKLSLIQLGATTADKTSNLNRARNLILEASKDNKSDVVVLPVSIVCNDKQGLTGI